MVRDTLAFDGQNKLMCKTLTGWVDFE